MICKRFDVQGFVSFGVLDRGTCWNAVPFPVISVRFDGTWCKETVKLKRGTDRNLGDADNIIKQQYENGKTFSLLNHYFRSCG